MQTGGRGVPAAVRRLLIVMTKRLENRRREPAPRHGLRPPLSLANTNCCMATYWDGGRELEGRPSTTAEF